MAWFPCYRSFAPLSDGEFYAADAKKSVFVGAIPCTAWGTGRQRSAVWVASKFKGEHMVLREPNLGLHYACGSWGREGGTQEWMPI